MARLAIRRRSEFPPSIVDQIHRLRHRVFRERLGWEVTSVADHEIDAYDSLDPLFGVCFGSYDTVVGCWRLLPTTGRCLTKEVFRALLHGAPVPSDPDIWEATRFAVADTATTAASLGDIRNETAVLVEGLLLAGLQMGLSRVIAISDVRFERILGRTGLLTHRFGPALEYGTCKAVAGWFPVTTENLARVRQRAERSKQGRSAESAAAA